ncbi:LuxR family transcriptional regulator [Candidatus Fukatsuia endosymbiont of Tuberolachnus salignus]|uniref:LuxR family transcriptional regulator n=1 Tax=Candidatus Fukatsuia endosymbiont of Tuberolachnus salignus TaxID=3077957 RepID=UPI00313C49ED
MTTDAHHRENENREEKNVDSSQGISVKSFGSLVSFMEYNEESWGIKDLESRFMYANRATIELSKLPAGFDVEGRLDNECPTAWGDFAPELQKQDRDVEQKKKRRAMIQTNLWGQEHTLCEKFPFFKGKKCIGTVYHVTKFNFVSLYELFDKKIPPILVTEPPTGLFTDKELEVIFFMLKPDMTAKKAARKLCLSDRTVENRLQAIYGKSKVNSLSSLREFCLCEGFGQHIPERFISPGCTFL